MKRKKRILDVGCGSGKFVMFAKKLGMDSYGIEPSKFAVQEAKKHSLKVFMGTILKNKIKENKFDIITLHHVFEHVPSPSKTLSKAKKMLNKNGRIILTVPNIGSLSFFLLKNSWVGFDDTPKHLFFFSKDMLKKYAKKNKLKVEKVRYLTLPYYPLKTLSNFISKKLALKKKIRLEKSLILNLLFLPFCLFSVLIRKSDVVEIWLRK